MRRIVAITALLTTLLFPGASFAAPTSGTPSMTSQKADSSTYCADPEELEMLRLINEYRAENGVGPLSLSVSLGAAADHHSDSMATFNYFDPSHDLHFEGENQDQTITWQQNIADHGYPDNTHTSRAENLAAGYETAAETLAQWHGSPTHDEHLLSAKYSAIGIGRAFNPESEYRWYWTVTFGSLLDSMAVACDTSGANQSGAGSEIAVIRSGRNGSSTDSSAAYDGDEATAWYTTKARIPASGYVWFDLGNAQPISRIDYLFSEGGSADSFQIQVSDDKETWTTIAQLGEPAAGEWLSYDWSGQTRYVRFFFDNPNSDPVLGNLAEVRFYS